MRRKRFILLDRIVFWLITLMTIMPSFLSAYTAIDVLAADIGTVQASLTMYDGNASATGTVNGAGTSVDWVVTVTKFDSEDERAPKLELEYSSGLGSPYNISTNVQQINRTDIGAVTVLRGYTYSTAAETLTMTFTTDITDPISETVSIKMLAGTVSEEESGTMDILSSGNTKTISLVNPIAQAAAQAEAEAAARAEAEAAAQAEAESVAQAEAESAARAEAEAAAQAEAESAAQAEIEAQTAAEVAAQAAAEAEAQAAAEAEVQAAAEAEAQSNSEESSFAFASSFSLVSLLQSTVLTSSYTDSIAVNKTAVRTPGCRTYEVTLNITGTPPEKPVDVILVLDRSYSMISPYPSRLANLKIAANKFVDIVLGNGTTNNRINIVSFGGDNGNIGLATDATVDQAFSADPTTVKGKINAIQPLNGKWYTNTQAGLMMAGTQLANARPEAEKVVILFSDGVPTITIGGPRTETEPINLNNVNTLNTFTKTTQAGQALWPAARVFSIGLVAGYGTATRILAENLLDSVDNSGFYNAPSEADLVGIFEKISNQLNYSATNAVVTDVVGNDFNLVESSLPAGATYNPATRTITWSPGTIYTSAQLKYVVQAKPEFEGGLAYTNESAVLNYTDVNAMPATQTFPKPQVNVPARLSVTLTDATILLGDSIQLAIGNDPAAENYMSP
ncbi:MAG: vWA domain-containing protein, partial [Trichococcus sp.]|uniref:vWA domain-containing protein n=1 Tax=Trichococcus sp. TaxID=1985464 RepID=UPI003C3C601B